MMILKLSAKDGQVAIQSYSEDIKVADKCGLSCCNYGSNIFT